MSEITRTSSPIPLPKREMGEPRQRLEGDG